MTNTKARSREIQGAAADLLTETKTDITQAVDVRGLAKILAARTGCHYSVAKKHIAKAARLARGELVESGQWGGARPGAGYPKGEPRKTK